MFAALPGLVRFGDSRAKMDVAPKTRFKALIHYKNFSSRRALRGDGADTH
jgi:hypothetical protein